MICKKTGFFSILTLSRTLSFCALLLLFCLALFLVPGPAAAQGQGSGLLLGLRYEIARPNQGANAEGEGAPAFGYRTLWISPGETGLNVLQAGNVIIPAAKGFREVGIAHFASRRRTEDLLYAVPLGKAVKAKSIQDPNVETSYYSRTLLFAGPRHASIETASYGYFRGAAHPWAFNLLEVVSLDAPAKAVDIQHFFGLQGRQELAEAGARYLMHHPEERDVLSPDVSTKGWGLIRRGGEWVVRGILVYNNEVNRGAFAYFDVPLKPPSSLVGHDTLTPSWKAVREKVPEAVDAFSSPGGDLLGVMTTHELRLYRINGNIDFAHPTRIVPLKTNEAAVSIQWASAGQVKAWREQLKSVMK